MNLQRRNPTAAQSNINGVAALVMYFFRFAALFILSLILSSASAQGTDEDKIEALWAALQRGGHVALMRHALAPGTGDPANFKLDDCATQRNLSTEGRDQARRIGKTFEERGIAIGQVLASRWCRCLETARLLNLGIVKPFPALDSFFQRWDRRSQQTAELKRFVSAKRDGPSLVLVSHQVNISALTNVFPRQGEIVILQPTGDDFRVLGVIPQ